MWSCWISGVSPGKLHDFKWNKVLISSRINKQRPCWWNVIGGTSRSSEGTQSRQKHLRKDETTHCLVSSCCCKQVRLMLFYSRKQMQVSTCLVWNFWCDLIARLSKELFPAAPPPDALRQLPRWETRHWTFKASGDGSSTTCSVPYELHARDAIRNDWQTWISHYLIATQITKG